MERSLAELRLEDEQEVLMFEQEVDGAANEAEDDAPCDMTCSICLERTPCVDLSIVKKCEHQYCVNCILLWTTWGRNTCPMCKTPFDALYVYRQLDGSLSDYPVEESVVLLKRARWFQDFLKAREHDQVAHAAVPAALRERLGHGTEAPDSPTAAGGAAGAGAGAYRDWADVYEDYLDERLQEDEEIESFYFSAASGRARVVLGNRRFGGGGFVRGGRMFARPLPDAPAGGASGAGTSTTPNAGGGKKGEGRVAGGGEGVNGAGTSGERRCGKGGGWSPPSRGSKAAAAAELLGTSPVCGSAGAGGSASGSGSGRRAKRAARRAAADTG